MSHLCVYCSSSDAVDGGFFEAARDLGRRIGEGGHVLIYGGGRTGLMGAVARAAKDYGGRVIAVIPRFMAEKGVAFQDADETVLTEDMRERKAVMERRADAFLALPGGFGTLEEVLEVLTLRQLGLHGKPIVFVNTGGFYDPLVRMFDDLVERRFAKPSLLAAAAFAPGPAEALERIASYRPADLGSKWF